MAQAPTTQVVAVLALVATGQGLPLSSTTIHLTLLLAPAALVPRAPAVIPAPSSLARVEAMALAGPAARTTLAAQVVLVVVADKLVLTHPTLQEVLVMQEVIRL